jgi:hypothetical protein
MVSPLRSFEQFWPFYVSQHLDPRNRVLHVTGTTGVFATLVLGVLWSPYAFLACPIMGYGFAWIGHYVFEHNEPATFQYPLWSLRGDLRMYRLMLWGRMGPEIEKAEKLFPAKA